MRKEVIAYRMPKSPISEVFRTLRTNIQYMNTKKGLKTLMVTSTTPSEGKSWVTANLAVTFAQAGKKVILVDCDLRKSRQFSIFGVAPTPGISNYLSGVDSNGSESSEDISTYLKKTEVDNLYIIPAGNVPPNPSELLVSSQMEECVEKLKELCDLVIFDTTPSCLVTDAVIISRYVDTSIIVASHKSTKIDDLLKIKKDIENVGGKIAGVVINKVPITQKRYDSSYYYGTQDSSGKRRTSSSSSSSSRGTSHRSSSTQRKIEQEYRAEMDRKNIKDKTRSIIEQNKKSEDDQEMLKHLSDYINTEKSKLEGDNDD